VRTVLAVDGGNSKTDVALLDEDGRLLAAVRGPTTSHQAVGLEVGMARLADLVRRTHEQAGVDGPSAIGSYALAGADTARDVRAIDAALQQQGFADRTVVHNDTIGALRAGTDRSWGVVVICGAGVAAAGVAPDGRSARLDALGSISGDWGGGNDIGWAGLAAAVRAADGRGPATRLARDVPAWFGRRTPGALTAGFYAGRIDEGRVGELAPLVFRAAGDGDAAARAIVDRQADEVVAMARAMLRRLRLTRSDADVVLAGGVFRTDERGFWERLTSGILATAPHASIAKLTAPPVAGAALLGLDELVVERSEAARQAMGRTVRAALGAWDASVLAG
jgi:N-acetylglucosamine kinase-like BadF-type ATPase